MQKKEKIRSEIFKMDYSGVGIYMDNDQGDVRKIQYNVMYGQASDSDHSTFLFLYLLGMPGD